MKSPSEKIFDFYSSLSEEQQESLEAKWSEDPSSAVDEAITISKASGYSFDRDVLEATVKALLDEESEADVELSPEVMAAVAGGRGKRSRSRRSAKGAARTVRSSAREVRRTTRGIARSSKRASRSVSRKR